MKDRLKKLTSFSDGLKCKESQIDLHNVLGAKPLRLQKWIFFQIFKKKIAMPPFIRVQIIHSAFTFSCRTRNRSKPLINIVLHTTGKTNGQHCHAIIRIGKFSSICRIIYDISQKKFDTQTVIQPSKTVTYNPQENLLRVTNKPTNLFCS